MESKFTCPSCNTLTIGNYCRNCGEKKMDHHDYSIRHYLENALDLFTHFDSKFFRSTWLLVTRPGYLSSEYWQGRRVQYMKPLQLFIFINIIYYFSITLFQFDTFTTRLSVQLHGNDYYPAYAQQQVNKIIEQDNISYEAFETKYNEKTTVLSKTLIFLFIPIFALLFYSLFFRKRKYFLEHVVVATHFWAFNLVLLGVIFPLLMLPFLGLFNVLNISEAYITDDNIDSVFLQICLGIYLFIMLRQSYGAKYWYCILIASLIAWLFFNIIWVYRFLLFLITLRIH